MELTHQLFESLSILVLPLHNEPKAGLPVVKDIIEQQTRTIFLFDTCVVWIVVVERAHSYCVERIILGHTRVLLGDTSKDGPKVFSHNVQYFPLVTGQITLPWKRVLLD